MRYWMLRNEFATMVSSMGYIFGLRYPISTMLHVYLGDFQIIHRVKQCTRQCTNKLDTANYKEYLPR